MRTGRKPKRAIDRAEAGPGAQGGFTLLEVVLAMAILALLLVPILGAVTAGVRNVDKMEKRTVALRLAQDKMNELAMVKVPDTEETKTGDFGDDYPDYKWEMEVVQNPEIQLLQTQIPDLIGMDVHLRVIWEEAGSENSVEVSTLLLGKK